jgi:hypothetical protein
MIGRMQGLQHLLLAQPFLLWGEIPTHGAENGDRTKNHASLKIMYRRLIGKVGWYKRTYKIEVVGVRRKMER